MIIDKSNAYLLNTKELSFHDDTIDDNMAFDRSTKELIISIKKCGGNGKQYFKNIYERDDKKCLIKFENVAGYFSSSTDLWLNRYIIGIDYVDNNNELLLPKLSEFVKTRPFLENDALTNDNKDNKYMEIRILTGSLDEIRVVCESMIID